MSPFLFAYLIGGGALVAIGLIWLFDEAGMDGEPGYDSDYHKPVRLMLLSPVWPFAAVYGLYKLTMWAFKLEWKPFGP